MSSPQMKWRKNSLVSVNVKLKLGQGLMRVFVANQDRGYVGKTITVTQEEDQEAVASIIYTISRERQSSVTSQVRVVNKEVYASSQTH